MNEIVQIKDLIIGDELIQGTDSVELHRALEVKTDHRHWIKRRIQAARLVEHFDYEVLVNSDRNPSGGRPETIYALSADACKHVSMMEKTDRAFGVRRYFIEFEKAHRQPTVESLTEAIDRRVSEAMSRYADSRLKLMEAKLADFDLWPLGDYARSKKVIMLPREARPIGISLKSICRANGLRVGQAPSPARFNTPLRTYPKSVLDAHFALLLDRYRPVVQPSLFPVGVPQIKIPAGTGKTGVLLSQIKNDLAGK